MIKEQVGLTMDELKVFVAIGAKNFAVYIIKDEESGKWCIRMRTPQQDSEFFIQKQRGGTRLFAHLEDALRHAVLGFPGLNNLIVQYGDKELLLRGTDLSGIESAVS